MGFQKHNWIQYGKQADIISIELRDNTGRRIDSFNTNSNKHYAKIIKIIEDKYGFSPKGDEPEKKEDKEDKENWLKKDLEW